MSDTTDLSAASGLLRCPVCSARRHIDQGDVRRFFATGWPACHGLTMTWWTQHQVNDGLVPT